MIDTKTPGFAVGRELDKLGCRSSPTSEIVLTDCRVPASSVLGVEGEALWRIAFECFDWERTVMLASGVGGMAATLDDSIRYAKERKQFGRPIANFQVIAHKLAEMKINLEVCRTAVYRAAWLKQNGLPHQMEASIAKTLVGKLLGRERARGDPDPRRLRLPQGLPGRAGASGLEARLHRRRHHRDPEDDHQPAAAGRLTGG